MSESLSLLHTVNLQSFVVFGYSARLIGLSTASLASASEEAKVPRNGMRKIELVHDVAATGLSIASLIVQHSLLGISRRKARA